MKEQTTLHLYPRFMAEIEKIKFEALYSYKSNNVILMNNQVGFGAKLTMDVLNKQTYPMMAKDFTNSRFDCLFYPPFYISNLYDESIKQEINALIGSVVTGQNYHEFILKMRSLFGYFSHDPKADFSNHANYYKPLDKDEYFGKVIILDQEMTYGKQTFRLRYEYSEGKSVQFSIQCFTPEAVLKSLERFPKIFPPHLLYKNEAKTTEHILSVLSAIRYSSENELLLKLATFTEDIDTSKVLPIPLTSGVEKIYFIHSFGKLLS